MSEPQQPETNPLCSQCGCRACHPSLHAHSSNQLRNQAQHALLREPGEIVWPRWLQGRQHTLVLTERSRSITEENNSCFLATATTFSTASPHQRSIPPSASPASHLRYNVRHRWCCNLSWTKATYKVVVSKGFHWSETWASEVPALHTKEQFRLTVALKNCANSSLPKGNSSVLPWSTISRAHLANAIRASQGTDPCQGIHKSCSVVSTILLGALFAILATFQEITFGILFPQMPSNPNTWWIVGAKPPRHPCGLTVQRSLHQRKHQPEKQPSPSISAPSSPLDLVPSPLSSLQVGSSVCSEAAIMLTDPVLQQYCDVQ